MNVTHNNNPTIMLIKIPIGLKRDTICDFNFLTCAVFRIISSFMSDNWSFKRVSIASPFSKISCSVFSTLDNLFSIERKLICCTCIRQRSSMFYTTVFKMDCICVPKRA